jgi:hypothetical protein
MIKKYQNAELQRSSKKQIMFIDSILKLAVNGLNDMFIEAELEFAAKKKLVDDEIILDGRNTRYTLINLIGLYKAQCNGYNIKIDLKKVLASQVKKADKFDGIGEIGLLLWATALISPEKLLKILTKINFQNILNTYKDAKNKLTMEHSWLLIGVLVASTFNETFKNSIGTLPEKLFKIIRKNYGGSGIFKHQDDNKILGKFRGNIGSFADQVYPIYAFSLFSKLRNNEEALLIANECANTLCNNQGENGEWLWHYDSRDGNVISKYPVYSVHQDAMAPMALFAVQKASGIYYQDYILKGLDWLVENAEMIDTKNNIIWRSINPPEAHRKFKSTLAHFGISTDEEYNNLEVTKECWSYHLGWLLHAFAGRGNNIDIPEIESLSQQKELKLYNIK